MTSKLAISAFIVSVITSLNIIFMLSSDLYFLPKILSTISSSLLSYGGITGLALSMIAEKHISKKDTKSNKLRKISLILSIINIVAIPLVILEDFGRIFYSG